MLVSGRVVDCRAPSQCRGDNTIPDAPCVKYVFQTWLAFMVNASQITLGLDPTRCY